MAFKRLFPFIFPLTIATASAAEKPSIDQNLMLVLREVEGANKLKFGYEPSGPSTATLSDGKIVSLNLAWFALIGDMHVRFVMDGENTMQNLTAEEFSALGLTPEQAVDVAIKNIESRYGEPKSTPWEDGIMIVAGDSPDLDSSYFLDRKFWNALLKKYPDGVVVGIPKRGGLLYAPVSDKKAVSTLERSIRSLFESSEDMRVSSALYLCKDGAWTVYRKPSTLN